MKVQSNFENITLACDLSLNAPGFAVLATNKQTGSPMILDARSLKLTKYKDHAPKLSATSRLMSDLVTMYEPDYVVREKGFSRFAATTQALFKVVGACDLALYQLGYVLPTAELSPTTVKKTITGDGKASKEAVQYAVLRHLNIDMPNYFANDDESDAAAVGLAFLKKKGLIML